MVSHKIKAAQNEYGEVYRVGEWVRHQDSSVGIALIQAFYLRGEEIVAETSKGLANISYLVKFDRDHLKVNCKI